MSWVTRGQRRYFYRSVRVNGQPRRLYIGRGDDAEAAAVEIEHRQAERAAQLEARRSEEARHAAAVSALVDLCTLSDMLVQATLTSMGFHQYNRGAWRRKRHVRDSNHADAEDLPRCPADDLAEGERR